MLSAMSRGHRLSPTALLAALAAIFSHTAFAQMEHLNAQMNAQQMAPAAAAAAPAVPNPDCTLIVPHHALSARGLATPFRLVATDPNAGPCNEANTAQSAFVEAAVFDPANSQISIYHPLVIDAGTKPAAAPVVPKLPANAIVALWIGFNGNNLTLVGANSNSDILEDANCVNGTPGSIFTQVSYCNAPAFFGAANNAAINGTLKVPALATAKDGQTCPTVRSFSIVDQDQSDNVDTMYLATANGTIAQKTKANGAALNGATTILNPGDNSLLSYFVLPALGCSPWMMPSLDDPGQMVPSQAVNELQAHLLQKTPVARVPSRDPMVEVNGQPDLWKDNLYRAGMDQPQASDHTFKTAPYCRQMLRALPKMVLDQQLESNFPAIAPAAATNTFTFLAQRWVASWQLLTCQNLINIAAPITLTTDANTGVVTAASINTQQLNSDIQSIAGSLDSDNAIYSN